MNGRANSIKSAIGDFMVKRGISGGMEQNLIKETIHLHLLSALSEAGYFATSYFKAVQHYVFAMGESDTAKTSTLSAGKRGLTHKIEFEKLVESALETTKRHLHRQFDINPDEILLKQPLFPLAIKSDLAKVAAWQISVPIAPLRHLPKSRIKIEFANVPSYDSGP